MSKNDSSSAGKRQDKGWSHLVAGGVAGCSAVLLLHPFDVVKTRLQVQDGLGGQLPAYRGSVDAVRTIVSREGWRGLYAGLAPALLGSTVSWGAYLYLYERLKAWHRDRQGQGGGTKLSTTWNLLAAAQAGAMVCVLTNPIWLIKTRLALQQRTQATAATAYRGIADAFVQIGRREGPRGYYKGFGPSLLLQTAHGAIQFAAYEELKHMAARTGRSPDAADRVLAAAEVSAYGAASKFLAAVTTYPTQVIRSRLQQRFEGRSLVYSSSWQAVKLTAQREGLAGFYKGLLPSLMRVMPQSAITLLVYEAVVKVLEGTGDDGQDESEQQQQQTRLQWAGKQQQHREGEDHHHHHQQQQQHRRWFQHRRRQPSLSDQMTPLIIAADSQAEQ